MKRFYELSSASPNGVRPPVVFRKLGKLFFLIFSLFSFNLKAYTIVQYGILGLLNSKHRGYEVYLNATTSNIEATIDHIDDVAVHK